MIKELIKKYKTSFVCFLMGGIMIIRHHQADEVFSALTSLLGAYFWIALGLIFKVMGDIEEIKNKLEDGKQ